MATQLEIPADALARLEMLFVEEQPEANDELQTTSED